MKANHLLFTKFFYVILFVYVLLRAVNMSFVHDEGLSYAILKGDVDMAATANNHILNTFLMGVFGNLFGESEIAFRLPNVIAFAFYIWGCFCILKRSKHFGLFVLANVLLLLNPFLLDFFSLARGYGLSMALLIWSLYFLLRDGFSQKSYRSLVINFSLSLLFAGFACVANLSIANYLITVVVLFCIKYFVFMNQHGKQPFQRHLLFLGVASVSLIPLFVAVQRLLILSKANQLYYGTEFIGEAMDSLIIDSLYFSRFSWEVGLKYIVALIFISGCYFLIKSKAYYGKFCVITSLIVVLVIGLVAEHYLFDVKYPLSRTSLLFIPLFALFVYYFGVHLAENNVLRKNVAKPILFVISGFMCLHFLWNVSLIRTLTWKYDAHTKEIMEIVGELSKSKKRKTTISNDWLYSPSINYYIISRGLNVELTDRDGVNPKTDFIYKRGDVSDVSGFVKIINYEDSVTMLLKKE